MDYIANITLELGLAFTLNEIMNNNVLCLSNAFLESSNGILYCYVFNACTKQKKREIKDFIKLHSNYILNTYNRRTENLNYFIVVQFI